ncbi:TIGR02611 family protein [uncultured Phycicoccus sp.]|uniref:TIGR02611 family protein n=1 Tax=uncultured Phycicoccus sp. TaxID=661422 RepID=UPI00261B0265|nr:TIGR02611 family protein [uncultured Phycicoccus sp.]
MTDDSDAPAGTPRAENGDGHPAARERHLVGPDWQWRHRLRDNPATHRLYRVVVGILGLVLVAGGLLLVPLPGPGWLIVIIGIAVWATEFERAQRLLDFVKDRVRAWEDWVRHQPRYVQGAVALATFAFVATVVWLSFRLIGVPGFVPDDVATWLHVNAGL